MSTMMIDFFLENAVVEICAASATHGNYKSSELQVFHNCDVGTTVTLIKF